MTPDHVNPEAPWPQLQVLEQAATDAGKQLLPRLALYPEYVVQPETWLDQGLRTAVLRRIDSTGYPRTDRWAPGSLTDVPALPGQSCVPDTTWAARSIETPSQPPTASAWMSGISRIFSRLADATRKFFAPRPTNCAHRW